ncbi:MAG: hypothetical protein ACYTGP_02990 [Planctomycetota bacterium]
MIQPFLFDRDDPADAARREGLHALATSIEIKRRQISPLLEADYALMHHPERLAVNWREWCRTYATRLRGGEPLRSEKTEWDRAEASFNDVVAEWREQLAGFRESVDEATADEPETAP